VETGDYYALLDEEISLQKETGRNCGDCRVCCTIFDVPEVPKAAGAPCPNICDAGCKLHDSSLKPKPCVAFQCLYLDGTVDVRPNESRVIGRRLLVAEKRLGFGPIIQIQLADGLDQVEESSLETLSSIARGVLDRGGLADVFFPGPEYLPTGTQTAQFGSSEDAVMAYRALFPDRFKPGE
jgi:hypothetical protein